MKWKKLLLVVSCLLLMSAALSAQKRDALNDAESDQLREVAQEPYKRLKLYIKFATERLDAVEAVQKDEKGVRRGQKMHDALEDFRQIVDELDDNIDDYVEKQSDLRKGLTEVINAEQSFDTRLKALKEHAQDPKYETEYKQYSYAMQDAMEAINLSLEDAKKTLDEQSTAMGKKK